MRASWLGLVAVLSLSWGVTPAQADMSRREFSDLQREAQRAAVEGRHRAVADAIRQFGRESSDKAVEVIAELATAVLDTTVYDAARDALARMEGEALDEMISTLERSRGSTPSKILFCDAFGERDDPRSAEGLAAAIRNGERQETVARAAIQAAVKRGENRCVDAMIDLFEELEGEENSLLFNQLEGGLRSITGESFRTAQDWRNFWEPRRNNFQRPVTGNTDRASTGERERPRFFGSEIRSNRLVFVIDVSGSMEAADPPVTGGGGRGPRGPRTGGGAGQPAGSGSRVRIERAKEQLKAVIEALPDDVHFTIIAYSGILMQGASGGGTLPPGTPENGPLPPVIGGFEWLQTFSGSLVRANSRSKGSALEFVDNLQANGMTFTYNALLAAFQVEGADTVVLLSDGVPSEVHRETGAEMSTDEILEQVRSINRFRRMRIDTFGFDPSDGAMGGSQMRGMPSLSQFMQDLAEQNDGEYTQIQ